MALPERRRLRFGFANVNGIRNKGGAVVSFFKANELDVMVLVETWLGPTSAALPIRGIFADVRHDTVYARGRSHGGIMVLAGAKVRKSMNVVKTDEGKRWVLIKVEDYFLLCCYFSPAPEARDEIAVMMNTVSNLPKVSADNLMVVGDFNARMGEASGDSLKCARGKWFLDEFLDLYGLERIRPASGKWTTVNAQGKGITDHALRLVDSDVVMEDLTVHEQCDLDGSDHRPLTWSVHTFRSFVLPTITRWHLARLKDEVYAEQLSKILQNTFFKAFEKMIQLYQRASLLPHNVTGTHVEAQDIVNGMNNIFVGWINYACAHSIGKAHYDVGELSLRFNNDKVEQVRAALRRVCSTVSQSQPNTPQYEQAYNQYTAAKAHYKAVCDERRYEVYEEFVEEMASTHNRAAFQKTVSSIKKREARSTCQLDPNRMQEYVQFYGTTFGAEPQGVQVEIESERQTWPSDCVVDFSENAVHSALNFFKAGKAAGPDEIAAELVHHESELSCQLLSLLFSVCHKFAVVPSVWCRANVALIYKKKGDIDNVANYRPISLTCMLRRLYERLLLNYLRPVTEQFLMPSQGGFRPGRGTLQQCYALHEIMNVNKDAVHVFLDLKAAYDCVNRNILWRDMLARGIQAHMVSVCRSLFDDNVANLVVNGHSSEDIPCRRGLLQGSSLSPLLFNVYINPLLERLDKQPKLTSRRLASNNLFFADDGALHAVATNMQKLLDVCSAWAVEYGMTFSAPKSAVMWKRAEGSGRVFSIQGEAIQFVDAFVYLGVECNHKGVRFKEKHRQRIAEFLKTAAFMKSKGMNALGWRPQCRVIVYKSFLRPMIEYGLPLMFEGDKMIDFMEKAQNTVLNMLLSSDRASSRGAKLKLLQIETMEARRDKLQYLFNKQLEYICDKAAPAAVLWHQPGRGRRSKMRAALLDNRIVQYSLEHNTKEVEQFLVATKYQSMGSYDMYKDGKADIAASIASPTRAHRSVYLDPGVDKTAQRDITYLRLGAYAFHQACKKCGAETSREHALSCSGEEARLRSVFAREYHMFQDSDSSRSLLFQDYLLNIMDKSYAGSGTVEQQYGKSIFDALVATARCIRSDISGYVLAENGRTWYHPLKIRKGKKHHKKRSPPLKARCTARTT